MNAFREPVRRIVVCLFSIAALASSTGCGGDDGSPLTDDAFVAKANAICQAGDRALVDKGRGLLRNPNTPVEEITKFNLKESIPNTRDRLKEIGKLKPPATMKDTIKKMIAAGNSAADTLERGLKKQGIEQRGKSEAFKEFDELVRDLEIPDCAASA